MKFHVLTLFPEMIMNGLGTSITGRAIRQNLISLNAVNIRDFSSDKHNRVDDYTYGGGAGMLMQPQPVYDAWKSVRDAIPPEHSLRTIYVTPQGLPFTQHMAESFAGSDELIFLCGHYEGIDERVLEETVTDYVSIGDYVLTGGELAAMVMIDCISRLIPGVLHNEVSADTESFHGNLLEYPQYSRPEEWHGKRVPEVLLSGNQKEVDAWRLEKSMERTRERRPDLFCRYQQLQDIRKILRKEKMLHMDMISAIDQGRAEVLYDGGDKILLHSMNASLYLYADRNPGEKGYPDLWKVLEEEKGEIRIVLHQNLPLAMESTGIEEASAGRIIECRELRQSVLTRKEKLPVRGLYRPDGKPTPEGLILRRLDPTEAMALRQQLCPQLLAEGEAAETTGAFLQDFPVGIGEIDPEGRISFLYVKEEYRRRKIGRALLTCLCNRLLEAGQTPYIQYPPACPEIQNLAEKTGMYTAGPSLWEVQIKK